MEGTVFHLVSAPVLEASLEQHVHKGVSVSLDVSMGCVLAALALAVEDGKELDVTKPFVSLHVQMVATASPLDTAHALLDGLDRDVASFCARFDASMESV